MRLLLTINTRGAFVHSCICYTYSKHLLTKSTKSGSLQRNTWANGLVPGFRLRFFEFVMQRGLPRESKNKRRRDA